MIILLVRLLIFLLDWRLKNFKEGWHSEMKNWSVHWESGNLSSFLCLLLLYTAWGFPCLRITVTEARLVSLYHPNEVERRAGGIIVFSPGKPTRRHGGVETLKPFISHWQVIDSLRVGGKGGETGYQIRLISHPSTLTTTNSIQSISIFCQYQSASQQLSFNKHFQKIVSVRQ